ncbi:MAG: exosortase/archaeosortase family protein [Phycisphaerales bacterium]|nr:exosortase/archaeosortase family protein [Phycisphaerales bacterium]
MQKSQNTPFEPTHSAADAPKREADWLVPSPLVATIIAVAIIGSLFFAFRDFFLLQYHYATTDSADWGHTLFIPLIALYVVFLHKADLFARPFQSTWGGMGLIALGLVWYAATWLAPDSTFLNSHNMRAVGVFFGLLGACVAILGWRSLVWLWFPLLYVFVFGQRITDKVLLEITLPMQSMAAWGSWQALDLIGYDLMPLRGNYIEILLPGGNTYPLDVAEACSGMRMLMAFLALGTVIAYVGLDRWWLRILLIAAGLPIAIFINVLRICTLGIFGMNGEEFMFGEFHSLIGLVWMIPTFGLFMLLMWFLQPLDEDEDGNRLRRGAGSAETRATAPPRFSRSAVLICAATSILLCTGGIAINTTVDAFGLHLVKKQVQPREALASVPTTLGGWKKTGEDEVFRDTIIEVLGTNQYLQRVYVDSEAEQPGALQLHLAYYTDLAGTAPHIPEVCWANSGLLSVRDPFNIDLELPEMGTFTETINRATGLPYQVIPFTDPVTGATSELPLPIGKISLRTTIFTNPENPSTRNLGAYFFIANGRTTASAMAVENVAFDLTSEYAYYCKIQLNSTYISMSEQDDEKILALFETQVTDFMSALLPELARILPDWRAYEGS